MSFCLLHYFFPQESNDYRSKIIHPSALVFYITVVVLLQVGFNVLSFIKPGVLGYATDISVNRLLELTNQKRAENGLGPLTIDNQLSVAATAKANDMFSVNYWAHNSPTGGTPWDFILGSGYHYVYAGENLAKDFADSSGVVAAWMASPTHRDNVVNPKYQDIGFAVVNGKLNGLETTLVVQMFGTRAPTAQQQVSQPLAQYQPATVTLPIRNLNQPTLPSLTITATPTITEIAIVSPVKKPPLAGMIASLTNSSPTKPKFNIFSLTKQFSLILVIILVLVLAIDGYVAFRDKFERITGDNLAHIGFLAILVLAVLATTVGIIM